MVTFCGRFETSIHDCDGDAKTFATLLELKPYCPDVTVIKYECVGHVQTRLGSALRKLKSGVVDEDGRVVKFKRGLLTRQLSH